jgi:diguanylate cyclase (GGDEF)-like protein/PAS domain S-box-containing protein
LTRTLYDLADGNIDVAVPYMRRRDEVGRIAESLDAFRGALATRHEAEKALKLSQTQYRVIFERAAVGIAQVDGEGTIVRANDSLGRAFALPRASIEGMAVDDLFCLLDGPIGDFLLDSGCATLEAPFRRADGATVHGELTKAEVVDDGLEAPLRFILFHDITDRKQIEAELVRLATTDALTDIANRRHFLELAEREMQRARRHGRPLSLLMADIDHFKSINDRHGHAAGDAVLKAYVAALRRALRQEDVLGRLGGEEFGILLPETDMDSALEVAERLRRLIGEMEVDVGGAVLRPTHSIGVAVLRPTGGSFAELMSRADAALYEAKQRGRNCVHSSSDIDEGAAESA